MAKTAKNNVVNQSEPAEPKFSKDQIVRAAKYRNRRDLVTALLDDGKQYTINEVDSLIDNFMKGKVK